MAAIDTAMVEVCVGEPEGDFVDLFSEYRLKAFHYALQMVGNPDDAMDVTQDAFLKLHRHWHRRDPDRAFAPWMYAVVRNVAIDLLRKRSVHRETGLDSAAAERSSVPSPELEASRGELKAQLWREIRRLPDLQREALLLRDWHGLSYTEIAEATGANVTTINSRLHDARARLRERMRRQL